MRSVFFVLFSGALAREARAGGAPWVRKFGKLSIRENLVVTSAYSVRPSVRSLGVMEGNQLTARRGE